MGPHHSFLQIPRWLANALVLLLVVGHACDLSAYANVLAFSDAGEQAAHPVGHHSEGAEMTCDAVDAVSTTNPVQVGAALELVAVLPVVAPVQVWPVSSRHAKQPPPSRP